MASNVAMHALHAMARGGMYDLIGGGFSRYSTDDRWLVPHFEKMLYDNAQLASAYLHAYLISVDEQFRRVTEETLDFMLDEMLFRQKDGQDQFAGFISSLDADSDGEEGKYYIWTIDEIQELLGSHLGPLVIEAYGIRKEGNFEGANVFQRVKDDAALARQFDLSVEALQSQLTQARRILGEARKRAALQAKTTKSWFPGTHWR